MTSRAVAAMQTHAADAFPHEACGLLLGTAGRIVAAVPARNIHPAPATHFEIDPQALIDAHRAARAGTAPQVLGYYHSHPQGIAAPSATDRACASGDGRVWAILARREGLWDVTFWQDGEQGFAALPLCVIDG